MTLPNNPNPAGFDDGNPDPDKSTIRTSLICYQHVKEYFGKCLVLHVLSPSTRVLLSMGAPLSTTLASHQQFPACYSGPIPSGNPSFGATGGLPRLFFQIRKRIQENSSEDCL